MHVIIWDHDGFTESQYILGGGYVQQQFADEVGGGPGDNEAQAEAESRTRALKVIGLYR